MTLSVRDRITAGIARAGATMKMQISTAPTRLATHTTSSLQYYKSNPSQLKTELLSGLSVAIMQVPESLAFAFTAGVSPLQGLQSTFFIGLFGGLFGGRPGMISGIAGAMVVVMANVIRPSSGYLADLCLAERLEIAYATMLFAGLLQVTLSAVGAPRLVRLIPYPVHVGFANGLAVIVFRAQLGAFKVDDMSQAGGGGTKAEDATCPPTNVKVQPPQRWLQGGELQLLLVMVLVAVTMFVMHFQTKIKRRLHIGRFTLSNKLIPSSLTAMLIATLIEHLIYRRAFGVHTKTVGDLASLRGSAPVFHWPSVDVGRHWKVIGQYGASLCAIGSIESLMTMELCADLAQEKLKSTAGVQEELAQGMGNIMASLFSTVGGSAMVGQSAVNVLNGARGRVSSVSASIFIFILILAAGPAIEMLPAATLTGILFVVVLHAFEWRTFKYFWRRQMCWADCVTVVLVTVLAVMTDLAIAVAAGVVWSSLMLAWNASFTVTVRSDGVQRVINKTDTSDFGGSDEKIGVDDGPDTLPPSSAIRFRIYGPLFFASAPTIRKHLQPHASHPPIAVADFTHATVLDYSAVEALKEMSEKWRERDGRLVLVGLDESSRRMVARAGKLREALVGAVDVRGGEVGDVSRSTSAFEVAGEPITHLHPWGANTAATGSTTEESISVHASDTELVRRHREERTTGRGVGLQDSEKGLDNV
ncbi:hypothetical protein HK104_010501 [Borealophlyctis nickersoniae]|nr:hypothetical protein HK104_010501 [Borealophlyctis nickersoniae]